jgi:DNA polymerase
MLLSELGLTDAKTLRSTKAFATKLMGLGVDVEYKLNGKGKEIPAFAKDDEFMREHANSPNAAVRLAIKGRLAFQSNLEINRTQRLIDMAKVTGGKMLVSLNFHAAHTGRFGGAENINVQNFKRGSLIRQAIRAPDGCLLVCVDASQIEARIVGWLANCQSIVSAFAEGRDLYAEFASIVFGYPVHKDTHKTERQVGKVCILQLGYQSGHSKLKRTLEKSGIVVTDEEAYGYVTTYRLSYREIPRMWRAAERCLRACVEDQRARDFAIPGMLFTYHGIKLPSNRWIYYPHLMIDDNTGEMIYWAAKYKSWTQLYGGKLIENITQAIARDVVTETHVKHVNDVVLQTHDELVQVVPYNAAWDRMDATIQDMSIAPDWLTHEHIGPPPLAAEGYVSHFYANPN